MTNKLNYYLLKKNGKEYRCESKAAAFEMWDCLGRGNIIIEHHFEDYDPDNNLKEYVNTFTKMSRKTLKSGEVKYYCR